MADDFEDEEFEEEEDDLAVEFLEPDPVRWQKSIAVSDFMQWAANLAQINASYMRVVANRFASDTQFECDMVSFFDEARADIEQVPTTSEE